MHDSAGRLARREQTMGIWIELGIFIVVLIAGIWQWNDARKALARTRAERLARESATPPADEHLR